MVYQLKKIRYKDKDRHILLQNENGPCPLLAAVNCLILKGTVELPSTCIGAGIVTIDQLVNVLAEKILTTHTSGQVDHHVQEVLTIFPSLQFGMDVNPKFTAGPAGVEYTMHLNAFDLLQVDLVHGWLLEPEADEYELIGNNTYNQLVNLVIEGNDAEITLQNADRTEGPISEDHAALSTKATTGAIVKQFLDRSGHQLTQYGLDVLYEYLKDGQMVVFFRNNHFNTLTKHEGMLYLLVTDFGYANVPTVIWEKLDVIDGDTEYVNSQFSTSPPADNVNAGSTSHDPQSQSDYHLALQLSQENSQSRIGGVPLFRRPGSQAVSFDADLQAAQQASVEEYNRLNPHDPIPVESPQRVNNGAESTSSFGEQVTLFSERMKQAGTSIGTSIQEAAVSASTIIQPAGFQSTGSVGTTNTTAQPSLLLPLSMMAVAGTPDEMTLQENQDRMLAMQLQQEEESRRAQLNHPVPSDHNLAAEMGRRERERQSRHVSQPGAPPSRLPTTPLRRHRSSEGEKCFIS